LVEVAAGVAGVDDELLAVEGLAVGGLELVWALAATVIAAINRIKGACFIVVENPD